MNYKLNAINCIYKRLLHLGINMGTWENVYNFAMEDWASYFVSESGIYVKSDGSCQQPGGKGKIDIFKWGNSKSKPTYGHTFIEHGAKNTTTT